jgi:reactive intermediate/imine deaminase
MSKQPVQTSGAPAAIGTYSQAIHSRSTHTVYLSGQIPLEPTTMELVSQEFGAQAHQVFRNLCAVADAAGGSLADCVKLNIYLTDLNNFAELNNIMAQYCDEPYPARAAVQVSALPKGASIEIDGVMTLE